MRRSILAAVLVLGAAAACQKSKTADKEQGQKPAATVADAGPAVRPNQRPQETPPLPVDKPPADATKSASGLLYKKLSDGSGPSPGRNDRVKIHYTGWKANGETFFSTRTKGQPVPVDLWNVAPGFAEGVMMMKKGEKAMLWIPPEIAYRGKPMGQPETMVFAIELVDIEPAPPVPADVETPPKDAVKAGKGVVCKTLQPGTAKDKPQSQDKVTLRYTAWDTTGKMFDSTELRKQPRSGPLFRESAGLEEAVKQMVVGEKSRCWIPGAQLKKGPLTPEGTAVYDLELVSIEKQPAPPAVPKDVAAPPKNAKKTEKGVFYKVMKKGTGKEHPVAESTVKVHYTGWTTDGRMFDSSVTRGQPAEFSLGRVIPGWTDGLQTMVVGESTRFWIPEEMAYRGQPGKPEGMLVFDIELLEIKAAAGGRPHP